MQSEELQLADYTAFMIIGNPGCGKSTLATLWLNTLKKTRIYALDSSAYGFMNLMDNECVIDLAQVDLAEFINEIQEELSRRRTELVEAKRAKRDTAEVCSNWQQIVIAFDKFSEVTDDMEYDDLCEFLVRVTKQEYGMKVMVLALDTADGFSGNYASVCKAVQNAQTGLLLGSLKEHDTRVFNVNLPYGSPEKEIVFGDGYIVKKNKYTGLRVAF